jgi:hypothetical protein
MGKPGWGHAQSLPPEHIGWVEGTGGIETSQYPEERKATCDSLSSGERNGTSLNRRSGTACRRCCDGVVGAIRKDGRPSEELQSRLLVEAVWKAASQRVTTPYTKTSDLLMDFPSNTGSGKARVNLRGPPRKAKYKLATDSARVP